MASGVVVSFEIRRGFGFIRSSEYPEDVFVHVEAVEGRVPLQAGQRVEFIAEPSDRGLRATRVVPGRVGLSPTKKAAGFLIAILIVVTGGLHQIGLGWVGAYLGAIGASTWAAFAWDKRQAGLDGRRIPESTLLGLSFVGGSPVGLAAMFVLRHKSRKRSFQAKFAAVLVVQALVLAGWYVLKNS
jgi:uncharacterized membrane protein YsdA (DUF1294 family)/cold shock CspA family protein